MYFIKLDLNWITVENASSTKSCIMNMELKKLLHLGKDYSSLLKLLGPGYRLPFQ